MRYLIIPISIIMLLFSSCSNFLEETSQSEMVPRSAETLNELLLGEAYQSYNYGDNPMVQFFDDELEINRPLTGTDHFYLYTWQPDHEFHVENGTLQFMPWSRYYGYIQICNTVLDYLPKVSGKSSFKDYVAGQARLLRAFYYFKLVNFYGLPYTDKRTDPSSNPGVPLMLVGGVSLETEARSSVEEVYQQIIEDVEQGIVLLEHSQMQHNAYRIGSTAGHLLASRIYLYMGRWAEAIAHADQVLEDKNTLMDLRTWGGPDPRTKPIIGVGNPETIWTFGSRQDVIVSNLVVADAFQMSADLVASFEPGDLRNGIYFSENRPTKLPPSNLMFMAQTFRASEAYLNRAEAHAQLYKEGSASNGQAAIDDVNRLRERRFTADTFEKWDLVDADVLIDMIRAERRREFFREAENRWFDLRRYGMPSIEHFYWTSPTTTERYVLEEGDPFYTLSIPESAISLNPKLEQNPLAPKREPK